MEQQTMDPRDWEYKLILEKEVDQQFQMESLVHKFAIVLRDTIIFLWDAMMVAVFN